jgi:hypothetical protein
MWKSLSHYAYTDRYETECQTWLPFKDNDVGRHVSVLPHVTALEALHSAAKFRLTKWLAHQTITSMVQDIPPRHICGSDVFEPIV